MFKLSKDRLTIILLAVSLILLAVAMIMDLSLTVCYLILAWIVILVLFGIISYDFSDRPE